MIQIDIGDGQVVEREIPPFTGTIKPGCIRYGFLPSFSPNNILEGNDPYDMEKCKELRKKQGNDNYTWYQFLREVNFLDHHTAVTLCEYLLYNTQTVLKSMGMETTPEFIKRSAAESYAEWYVGWLRIANRYWWYEKALVDGIPDPLYEPPPPIFSQSRIYLDGPNVHGKRFMQYANRVANNSLDAVSNAILYAFGYIPAKPDWIRNEEWENALQGLFLDPFPLISMVVSPGDYINLIACEEQSGNAGFYPTPLCITELMGEMVGAQTRNLFDFEWGTNAEARKIKLVEAVNDPCVGTGNFLWSLWNTKIIGEFTDINHSMVAATRALCALYAPWFTNSIFRANALEHPGKVREQIKEQFQEYGINEILARASFINSISNDLESYVPDPALEERAEVVTHTVNAIEMDQLNQRAEEDPGLASSQNDWSDLLNKLAGLIDNPQIEETTPAIVEPIEQVQVETEPVEESIQPLPELEPELVGEYQSASNVISDVKTKTNAKTKKLIQKGQMSFDLFNN